MKRKIVWVAVSCLMVLSLVLASCGPAAPEEEEEVIVPVEEEEEVTAPEEEEEVVVPVAEGPKYGGVIIICAGLSLNNPNPMQITPPIQSLSSYAYDYLGISDWTMGPAGTGELSFTNANYLTAFRGALAESWEQPDPYTYIFHLRQGVHWHNKPPVSGRELTADDVVWSLNDLLFSHPEIHKSVNARLIDSITALDKYTVEVKANAIDARLLQQFMVGNANAVHPPDMEETYGEGWGTIDGVCGTGPFIMMDFVSNSSAAFERNPDYWGYDELNPENQLPYADGVKWLMITDESTRLAALRTGKIDRLGASIENADSLKKTNPDLKWSSYLESIPICVFMRMDKEPYSDIRVRKALAMAIDREEIVRDYLRGQGEIFAYPTMSDMKDVYIPLEELPESTREQFEYNPEKARQLLADAGYPDGFQTECITATQYTERLQILTAYWRAIGVDCEIQVLDYGAYLNMAWGKKYPHMVFSENAVVNPIEVLEWKTTGAMFNVEMYSDPEYDAGVQELITTFDEAEQNRMIKELTLRFISAVPNIVFPSQYGYNFWWPWLENYHGEGGLSGQNDGGLVARLWVDQELKKAMGY